MRYGLCAVFVMLFLVSGCSKEDFWGTFKVNPKPKKEHLDTIIKVEEAKNLEIIDYDQEEE